MTMKVGMIGLGRMGANMVRRFLGGGHARGEADFQDRLLSSMRFEFGCHVEKGPGT